MVKKLSLGKPYFDECEIERIKNVLDSGCWAGTCEETKVFERKFAESVGTKYAIACSSCTTALHAALLAIGIGKGDEVIVPSFTFPATGFAVAYTQAKTILADIDMMTYTIDAIEARKRVTRKAKAIMPVYAFGMPPDVDAIIDLAEDNDLKIVWDAATGLGAEYKGKKAGSFADCECFSFYPTKNIATGEGGMITTNNEEIAEKAHSLVDFGTTKSVKIYDKIGYNYRLSAIQAAIGICQLEKLPKFLDAKRRIVEYYNKRLDELYWIGSQYEPVGVQSAWQRFVCHVLNVHELTRRIDNIQLISYLKEKGIGSAIGTYSLATQPFFLDRECCKNANHLYKNTIALPLYYGMTEEDVDYVIEKLVDFAR